MSVTFIACPWCGEIPKELNYHAQDGMKWAAGHCPNCEASTPPVRTNYNFEGRQPWMDEADAEWNRRAFGWIGDELQIIKLALEIMLEECGERGTEITDLISKVKYMQLDAAPVRSGG